MQTVWREPREPKTEAGTAIRNMWRRKKRLKHQAENMTRATMQKAKHSGNPEVPQPPVVVRVRSVGVEELEDGHLPPHMRRKVR